jgi:hypothetical protein
MTIFRCVSNFNLFKYVSVFVPLWLNDQSLNGRKKNEGKTCHTAAISNSNLPI